MKTYKIYYLIAIFLAGFVTSCGGNSHRDSTPDLVDLPPTDEFQDNEFGQGQGTDIPLPGVPDITGDGQPNSPFDGGDDDNFHGSGGGGDDGSDGASGGSTDTVLFCANNVDLWLDGDECECFSGSERIVSADNKHFQCRSESESESEPEPEPEPKECSISGQEWDDKEKKCKCPAGTKLYTSSTFTGFQCLKPIPTGTSSTSTTSQPNSLEDCPTATKTYHEKNSCTCPIGTKEEFAHTFHSSGTAPPKDMISCDDGQVVKLNCSSYFKGKTYTGYLTDHLSVGFPINIVGKKYNDKLEAGDPSTVSDNAPMVLDIDNNCHIKGTVSIFTNGAFKTFEITASIESVPYGNGSYDYHQITGASLATEDDEEIIEIDGWILKNEPQTVIQGELTYSEWDADADDGDGAFVWKKSAYVLFNDDFVPSSSNSQKKGGSGSDAKCAAAIVFFPFLAGDACD